MATKKNIVIVLFILFIFTGCAKKENFAIDDTLSIELQLGWRTVVIDDQEDIKNIITLISTMEIKANNDEISDNLGYFITNYGRQAFAISDENALKMGGTEYYGREQCIAIRKILDKNLYNEDLIVDAIKLSKSIVLIAQDMGIVKELTEIDKEKVISNTRFDWNQSLSNLDSEYPNYKLELKFDDNNIKEMLIIDDANIIFNDQNLGWVKFTTNEYLWLYISNIIKPKQLDNENDVAYLFNAVDIFIEEGIYIGDYKTKKNEIIRCFSETKKVENNHENDDVRIELKFVVNGRVYTVAIYNDGYKYKEQYYEHLGIYDEIIALITAG